MTFRHLLTLSLATALVAACNSSEDAEIVDDAAQPEAVLTQAPQPTAAPDGTALMAGTWTVNENPQGGRASFGEEGGEPSLSLTCEQLSGTLTMTVASSSQTPEAWRLDAGGEAARVDMAPVAGGLAAEVEPGLAIFRAFSTPGEIVVLTSALGEAMQFPTHPGISRVLDVCS